MIVSKLNLIDHKLKKKRRKNKKKKEFLKLKNQIEELKKNSIISVSSKNDNS